MFITAGSLSGNGTISANSIGGSYHGPGGGRVSVAVTNSGADFSLFTGTLSACPGAKGASYTNGAAGTVYTETAAQT